MEGRSCGCSGYCLGMARSCAGLKGDERLPLSSLVGRPSASRMAVSDPLRLHARTPHPHHAWKPLYCPELPLTNNIYAYIVAHHSHIMLETLLLP